VSEAPSEPPASEDTRRTRRDLVWNLVPVVLLAVVGLG
jgi:hypothetical protein